ncbi:MAG: DUF4857 domain-containing protein [Bacteroidaceae bacterium]|nr:DUF4857 domain-containing protein [Bacteroidaceae bacterium]
MFKTSKIFFCLLLLFMMVWQLPACYNFFVAKSVDTPFTLYSGIAGEFASLKLDEDKKMHYRDASGKEYTEEQFDSILPTFYYRQLVTDGRFPDSIHGVAVTPRQVQMSNFNMRISPLDLNKPRLGIQQMLESMSGRVDLELPDDAFRITAEGMEFVEMETNTIDPDKSARFTQMMKQKGFQFPATYLSGNPTDRKEYDEGYVMLDATKKLFHVKQTVGRPYVRAIALPEDMTPKHLFITEFPSRKWLCFLTDTDGYLWVVERDSYAVRRTEIPSFIPEEQSMLIIGNMFDWTVKANRGTEECYYAISAQDYTLIDSMAYQTPRYTIPGLSFTSTKDKFVKPRIVR